MQANPPGTQRSLLRPVPKVSTQTHRLFFALMPEDDVRRRLHRLAGWLQDRHPELRARWVKPERFHATLNFLGDYPMLPDEAIERAMAAANSLRASSFDWTLDYAASFRGREPPCVMRSMTVPALLLALWRELGSVLVQAGLHGRAERQYTPHVTLAYARCELPEPVPVEPIVWRVDHFVLVHSVVGKGHYRILGRWSLSA